MQEQASILAEVDVDNIAGFTALLEQASIIEKYLNNQDLPEPELATLASAATDQLNEQSVLYQGQPVICRGMFTELSLDSQSIVRHIEPSSGIIEGRFCKFYVTHTAIQEGEHEQAWARTLQLCSVIRVGATTVADEEGRAQARILYVVAPITAGETSLREEFEASLLDSCFYELEDSPETIDSLTQIFSSDEVSPADLSILQATFKGLWKKEAPSLVDSALVSANLLSRIRGKRFALRAPHIYEPKPSGNICTIPIDEKGVEGECLGFNLVWLPLSESIPDLCLSFLSHQQVFHVPIEAIEQIECKEEILSS